MIKKFAIVYSILATWLIIFLLFNISTILNIEKYVTQKSIAIIANDVNLLTSIITSTETALLVEKKPEIRTSTVLKESDEVNDVTEKNLIKLDVPFTTQAPFAEWSDERQQNACEEAAAVMAMAWVNGTEFSKQEARDQIVAISDWEMENYGVYQDTSATDTVDRIFRGYFKNENVNVVSDIISQNIIDELQKGNLAIVPVNGQELGNPYFTLPGPLEHMIVVIGYDYDSEEFIVNESGTRHGKDYHYDKDVLFDAIRDYPTGYREPVVDINKVMIVVSKQ